ncbi:hypothetical protein I545_0198 [Mycobacterium kansasii 662]|uniref:Uncharacterized protein n=2 Tax=Mycobacterium kansasii TaxID=1768 RepID=A0A1V3XWD8_MYCKA|nr:hypothetical protein I547_1225 [Mycobacterium kansasii 824]EUA20763.1 hypothetical protein I545_0198 [Mycobacterium kansasii 662]KEP43784.1 hypothetical protein MKSMC1_11480 [Mycobacterium kansasii]OOK67804.1 hypothetical protein BZL30_7693 [Mycobacterium kansasii]OOK83539.1 hypothetical protein BZL29_0237 [Mycobacterium kansasii]
MLRHPKDAEAEQNSRRTATWRHYRIQRTKRTVGVGDAAPAATTYVG